MLRVWREFTDDIASSNAGLRDSVEHHISGAIFQSELFIPLSLEKILFACPPRQYQVK